MPEAAIGGELTQLTAEYAILGELGRGGSAVVYRARDRNLGRDVAIRVVHPRPLSPDDDAVARLAREARTVAQLQHPNIVTVFAVKRLTGGGLALAMQLVPGRTLKAVVHQGGPLAADRCRRILRDVAEALAYAHARGVVHRDVKPENIFIDEESGRALLSDFGIARSEEHDSLTLTGTAIGTPFYMSPEQIDGAAIDGRSDLYSLGLVAWEMLTARRPWDGESLYNVIYKQKREELPPIEGLQPGVPLRLQYIIERMLQKNPAARWAGADGLLAQLSHTVLPGDYSRWQAALRKRVEKYREEERERERAAAEAPAESAGGLLASTMRFVRGAAALTGAARVGGARTSGRRSEPTPDRAPALANTQAFTRGGTLQEPPPNASEPESADAGSDSTNEAQRAAEAVNGAANGAGAQAVAPSSASRIADALAAASWEQVPRRRLLWWTAGGLAVVLLVAGGVVAMRRPDWVRARIDAVRAPIRRPVEPPPVATPTPPVAAAVPAASDSAKPEPAPSDAGVASALLRPGAMPPPMLSLGGRHSCVVAIDGTVLCWGANERGQLGDGTAQRQVAPARVAAELRFARVPAGTAQSCGVTRTGDVYCWGNDSGGQLGDATTVSRYAPVRVAGAGVYRSVASGDSHTCGITVEGSVHCWGWNARGQLGDVSTTPRTVPAPISAGAQRFVQVVLGGAYSCALASDGTAYCWGANDRGQLGVGDIGDRHVPTAVAGDLHFAALAAGSQHTCGVAVDGAVWCWGSNARGQLGVGTRSGATTPQRVRLTASATAVLAGGQTTCALTAAGEAYCWGANGSGQLGIGTQADATTPVRALAGEPATSIGLGSAHSC